MYDENIVGEMKIVLCKYSEIASQSCLRAPATEKMNYIDIFNGIVKCYLTVMAIQNEKFFYYIECKPYA